MKKYTVLCLSLIICSSAYSQLLEINRTSTNNVVRIDWESYPKQTYHVQQSPSLSPPSWTSITPSGLTPAHVIGTHSTSVGSTPMYYRVAKMDTDPPKVLPTPSESAIDVSSNATIYITLEDETGIDASSISLSIAGWKDMTTASAGIIYSGNTLTFVPPAILGSSGTIITNSITVSDTLGHTLTNYTWIYTIERVPVIPKEFLPLTAPPSALKTKTGASPSYPRIQAGSSDYHIISVASNAVIFSYTGTPPVITNGTHLVSYDSENIFYREVLSNTVDVARMEITAWTKEISLTEILQEGSFSGTDFGTESASARMMAQAETELQVNFNDTLNGKILYEDSDMKIHLPEFSWNFDCDISLSADIGFFELKSFDTTAKGVLTLNMKPELLVYLASSKYQQDITLGEPYTHVFYTQIGYVPVWVEVKLELVAGIDASTDTTGNIYTIIETEKEMTYSVKLRDNQWTHNIDNPPISITSDPLSWNISGDATAKIYITPKLTVYAVSLAGLRADMMPYAYLDGDYQVNPLEYNLNLALGFSSTLGIESRVWYDGWGDKPHWEILDFRKPLWSTVYPPELPIAPEFTVPLPDQTVYVGDSLILSAFATGQPEPEYQWYFEDQKIVDATAPEYRRSPVHLGHEGNYAVEAYSIAGNVSTSCYVMVKEKILTKPVQKEKLLPNDGEAWDMFGGAVSIGGNYALMGVASDDDNGSSSGSAYVFDITTGTQIAKLLPNDGRSSDYFGVSVSLSGNYALVGAYGNDDNGSSSGSAYVFDITTGTQIAKLLPNDGSPSDYFGVSVSLSGNYALVGAYGNDDNGSSSGSAYVFDITTGTQITKLLPNDVEAGDSFGMCVSLSGNYALVGAYGNDDNGSESGSAYIFDITTGTQNAKLLPNDGASSDYFGMCVSLSGNYALVGAWKDDDNGSDSGSAYVFDITTGTQITKLLPNDGSPSDYFGWGWAGSTSSVSLSGNYALVGAWADDDNGFTSGSAYVFDITTGTQITKLLPNDGEAGDSFGKSVSLSGNYALVGALEDDDNSSQSGSAYVFELP